MASVHLFLQGKGGSGKSTTAFFLAQYLSGRNRVVKCLDTDPVNHTLAGFPGLNAIQVDVVKDDAIDPTKFDEIVEFITHCDEDDSVIIDNGASSFIPFCEYLLSAQVPELLREMGHTVTIHTVIVGKAAMRDTIAGFKSLATIFAHPTEIVVWLNPYFGEVEENGKTFFEGNVYQSYQNRIAGIITLPNLKRETFGADLAKMLQRHQTFSEAIADPANSIMMRQRLKVACRTIFTQISGCPTL